MPVSHRLDRNFSNGHKSQMPVGKPGAWNTYRFSKGMFTFAAFLTSTSLYFTIVVVNGLPFNGVASTEVWRGSICTTNGCKATAKGILDSLNQNVDPCADFYEFVCGGWKRANQIPDDEPLNSQLWRVGENTKLKVQRVLQATKAPTFNSEATVKEIFLQCQDKDGQIEKAVGKPLLQLLDNQIGGWPVITPNWNPRNFDLTKTLVTLRAYLDEPLFITLVRKDQETPTKNVILLGEPNLFTNGDVLQNEDAELYMDSYSWYLRNVTSMLIADSDRRALLRNTTGINSDLTEIIDLERYLALAGQTTLDKLNTSLTKDKTTLRAVRQNIFRSSSIARNLTSYLKSVFAVAGLGNEISDNTNIVLKSPEFFKKLDSKLMEIERQGDQGKRYLANYIGWKLIYTYASGLSEKYRNAEDEYTRRILGQDEAKDISADEGCAETLIKFMPLAVSAMYVSQVVSKDLKEKTKVMAGDIRAGLGEILANATWMDATTNRAAVKKLAAMVQIVGYSDLLSGNLSVIDELYKNITLQNTLFNTSHEASKAKNIMNLRRLKQTNVRADPLISSPDVTEPNARYDPASNSITVQAGILQLPFYDSQSPQYLNYGAIGSVIGHEITHGFDNQGSLYDDQGNMRSWWSESTRKAYDLRGQGMVLQYNNFSLPFGRVNGKLTLGENIADNGGLKAAYLGYRRFRERQSCVEPALFGLDRFSFEQLFFIAAGQNWCSNQRPEIEKLSLLMDPHSPHRFRVIGEMSNLPAFSTAFKCSIGSKMNPLKKQTVW